MTYLDLVTAGGRCPTCHAPAGQHHARACERAGRVGTPGDVTPGDDVTLADGSTGNVVAVSEYLALVLVNGRQEWLGPETLVRRG